MKKIQALQLKQLDDSNTNSESEQQPIFQKRDIPTLKFNTKNLEGLNEKIQSLKICNYQSDFSTEITKVLELYDDTELQYNDNLVLFVMNEVENYILKPKSGKYKSNLVVEVCKKYFNDNPDLVNLVIKLVFDKLSQVKFIKRQGLKVIRFFFKFAKESCKSNFNS